MCTWFICVERNEMSMSQVLEAKEMKLPHPKGPLVKVIPSSALEFANAMVDNVISQWLQGSGSKNAHISFVFSSYSSSPFCTLCTFALKMCKHIL